MDKRLKDYLSGERYIVGVDEVGRGPLAGPVVVGAMFIDMKDKRKLKLLRGIKDSKKISAKKREEWNKLLKDNFEYHLASLSNNVVDKVGIQRAVLLGVERALGKMRHRPDIVLLDGLLKAPEVYKQKTIIKGDEIVSVISAASIVAKVSRDNKMILLGKKLPEYDFDKHKGYGTKLHYENIKENGLSSCHRKTFCVNCINYVS